MNGILLIDKPSDWTSNDVVIKLKGMLRQRRIGHSGTLDPMATGLLVVFVGRATRAVEFAEADCKRYIAGLRLGITTDTQDISGTVLDERSVGTGEEQLLAALDRFTGDIDQVPPMYSALKVNGQKLYDIARKGGVVERKARRINISDITLMGREGDDYILDVSCSKGTYIRTLCHDIGQSLGCGGCMSSLRRVKAGVFSVDNAYSLQQVQQAADAGMAESLLLPVDSLFSAYPSYIADRTQLKRIKNGNVFGAAVDDGKYRVYSEKGEFLMLGLAEKGNMKTIKSFFEVEVK